MIVSREHREYGIIVIHVIHTNETAHQVSGRALAEINSVISEEKNISGKILVATEISRGWTLGPNNDETRVIYSVRENNADR